MTATTKRELRQQIRQQTGSPAERKAQSEAICRHLLNSELYRNARVIGGYLPLPWEADILPVLTDALTKGKMLALPRTETPPIMTMRTITALDTMQPGRWSVPEPDEHAPMMPPEKIDLLLVPLEGVDRFGCRLGKGGGYYDVLLAKTNAVALGVAFSWQRVDQIPCEPWDKPLQAVCTVEGIQFFDKKRSSGRSR